MPTTSYTTAELCAGYSGLHLAMKAAGWPVELSWYAENDPDASTVLAARHPGVLNLGDITAAEWSSAEPVDVLTAGYPCQDLSNAGKRAGIEGAKSGIWRNVADAVRVLRPRLVLLENVRAHLARGFGRVLGDLAELGYDATWTCLRASDVGAPHQRDRVFILAAPTDPDREPLRLDHAPLGGSLGAPVAGGDREDVDGLNLLPTPTANLARGGGFPSPELAQDRRNAGRRMLDDAVALLPTPTASDSNGPGHAGEGGLNLRTAAALLPTPAARDSERGGWSIDEPGRPLSETVMRLLPTPRATDAAKGGPNQRGSSGDLMLPSAVALLPTPTATNSHGNERNGRGELLLPGAVLDRWVQYGPAIRRWEMVTGRPAPEPTITGRRGGQRLSGRFVEWMMGLPEGWVTDVVDNNAAVKICGNGVVPLQGAAAYAALVGRPG